jgi:rhamnosyltransferase
MRSICFFCSYYTGKSIPEYVKFYIQELKRHFTKVILVTNEKEMIPGDIVFFKNNDIDINLVVNEGYDFGMYYKMFKKYDVSDYDRVGLINDSCILFKKLDFVFQWIDEEQPDYCSLTDTNEVSYHLQSYFLVINKKAIPFVTDYFNKTGIVKDFWELVKVYEVGLSSYLLTNGLTIKACYPVRKNRRGNPTYLDTKYFIKKGSPMIKKKVFLLKYPDPDWIGLVKQGFNPYPAPYIKLIKKMTGASFPEAIFSGFVTDKNIGRKLKITVNFVMFGTYGLLLRTLSKMKRLIIKDGNKS